MSRLAHHEPNLVRGHVRLRAFFHANRRNAHRPKRTRRTGHGQTGRLDAYIVRSSRAAADSHAARVFNPTIIGRPTCHGMVQIVLAFQESRCGLTAEPLLEHVQQPLAQNVALEHTAVEQHMRRPHRFAGLLAVSLQKRCQVARHSRVGLERQPNFAKTRRPRSHWPVRRLTVWEKTIDQQVTDAAPIHFDRNRAADQFSTAAEHRNTVRCRP